MPLPQTLEEVDQVYTLLPNGKPEGDYRFWNVVLVKGYGNDEDTAMVVTLKNIIGRGMWPYVAKEIVEYHNLIVQNLLDKKEIN